MGTGIIVVDHGAGNLRSVLRAIERVGYRSLLSTRAEDVLGADVLILPGQGAAGDTMRHLREDGLVEPIKQYIGSGRPFLGVCIGLQTLMTFSEEHGRQDCLDVEPGRVRLLRGGDGLKIPHMGWNTVRQVRPHFIFRGVPDESYFYFVHSYVVEPVDPSVTLGVTEYGEPFPAMIARDNVVATQFHPEKSGEHGLRLYANFLRETLGGGAK
jgi:glutamine amidotransferase